MTFVSKGIESLRSEIDRYRQNLRDTEESIKKITGREGLENRYSNFNIKFTLIHLIYNRIHSWCLFAIIWREKLMLIIMFL